MHHDEANQAVRFGILLETGDYRYDRHDHHGPTLYYLTLPFAWMRGQRSLAALDEQTLRVVPAAFGASTLLLFLLLSRGIGRVAVASTAALAAVSPFVVYYNRFYIQEPLFVFFVVAFLVALGFYATRPGTGAAIAAGLAAGFAYATKETSIIVLPMAVVACVLARQTATLDISSGTDRDMLSVPVLRHAVAAAVAAVTPPLFLFTSLFRYPAGLIDSVGAFDIYVSRGVDPGPHVQPWFTYLKMFAWSSSDGLRWTEALVLVLAGIGGIHAIAARRTSFWPFYLCAYTILTTVVFSAVPYKTPWNALPFYIGFVFLAGIGVAAMLTRARRPIVRISMGIVLVAALSQLASQSVRANFTYPADPRNPYVYAHTTPDYLKLVSRVHELAAVHPAGHDMLVKVVAGPHEQWPFPWYARHLTQVGYWSSPLDAGRLSGVPVIVASQDRAPAVEAAVGDRYVSEFYGLRPDVLLTVYIERGLWDRFLQTRQ